MIIKAYSNRYDTKIFIFFKKKYELKFSIKKSKWKTNFRKLDFSTILSPFLHIQYKKEIEIF